MSIFDDEALEASEHFSGFNMLCIQFHADTDPTRLEMALESFPAELRGQALRRAYALAANFLNERLLTFTRAKGIDQLYPDLHHNLEVADRIRNTLFRQSMLTTAAHCELFRNVMAHHGVDYVLNCIDTVFSPEGLKADAPKNEYHASLDYFLKNMQLLVDLCPTDIRADLEIGNRVAYRFAEFLVKAERLPKNAPAMPVFHELAKLVCGFTISDTSALTVILKGDFYKTGEHFQSQFARCLPDALEHYSLERIEFLGQALKLVPQLMVERLASLNEPSFQKTMRGPLLDHFLGGNWLAPSAKALCDYGDQTFIDQLDAVCERLFADPLIVNRLERHPAFQAPDCNGLETLIMLPKLRKLGIYLPIESLDHYKRADSFADLVAHAGQFPGLGTYWQAGLDYLQQCFEKEFTRLYHHSFSTANIKGLKQPSEVSDEYKYKYMAVRLACEIGVNPKNESEAKRDIPVRHGMDNRDNAAFKKRVTISKGVAVEIARSLSEDEILDAIGKNKSYFRRMIELEILDRKHLARLPLQEQGEFFSKDLGL
jgi:hypothetical protein